MYKVAISLGHNPDAQGASFGGYTEYSSLAPLFGELIEALCMWEIKPYIVPTGGLNEDKIKYINSSVYDFAIELHMNADADADEEDDPIAYGCEMLYYEGSTKGEKFARAIQDEVVNNFCLRDRGIKGKTQFSFLRETNCPAVIAELGFIDSESDADLVRFNAKYLATLIALGIEKALDLA